MSWNDLSMREKAAMMRVAVKNKIFEIDKIKEAYDSLDKLVSNSEIINPNQYTPSVNLNINPALDYVGNALESISGYEYEGNPLNKLGIDMSLDLGTTGSSMYPNGVRFVKKFGEGGNYTVGNLVDAIYLNNPKEEHLGRPSHLDDLTQSEEWANAHGYYPDAKGHRDDRVKKPAHPSHPSRGTWQGDNFILTDKGFEDPNYTLFGLNDGGQDPLATLIYDDAIVLPEITATPNGKYINNSYDNIRLHLKSNGGKINRFNDGGPTSKNSEENVTIDYPPIVRKLASLVYIIDGNEIKFSPEEIMAMTNRKYDYASAINRKLSYMLYKYDLEHKGKYKHKHAIPTNFSTSITPLVKQENDEYYNSLSTEDLLKLLKEQKEINGIFEPLSLPKTISDGIHDAGKKVRQSAKVTSKQVKQIKEDAKKYEPMLKDSLESLLKLPEKIQEITEAAASENQEVRDDNFYMRNLFLDSTLTAFGIHGLLGNIANRWPQLAYRRVYNPHLPFSYTLVPTRLGLIAYFRPWNAARSMLAAIALDGIQAFLDPTEGGKTYNALEATSGLAGLIGFSDVLRGIPRIGPALDASFDILGVAQNFKDATNLVTNFDSWAIDKLNNWLEDDLNNSNTK